MTENTLTGVKTYLKRTPVNFSWGKRQEQPDMSRQDSENAESDDEQMDVDVDD